ncbi:hypothetical protein F511_35863 [Dorcoceras hygrometricum]|uniref:Uncharacterized protein n=1 Tax=Dorcoceras hygrometricum TaxID=472368 RepID=A0A2Z7BV30_9LAMI|nr:hypothetical protein F511_35863 [Dorcoceras hygrometricum]
MSSWTQSFISLDKLCEIQKQANNRTGLGFNTSESSFGETCTQSNLAHDKFKKMSFFKASVIHDPCESVRYDDQISELLNKKGKAGIGYDRPESSKSGWLKNRLDKEKAKAGSKSFVQNQQRRGSKKVKSEWKKAAVQYSQGYGDCGIKASQGLCHSNQSFAGKCWCGGSGRCTQGEETPVKKDVSRKRPAAVDEPIVKKKRTRVGKAAAVATDSALEEVPVQVVAISTVPPPAPKRKIQKRKKRLALGSDDEIVGEPTTVAVEAHGLRWEKPCYSKVFEGPNRDRGAVIARSNTNIKSTCWIRTMLCINGTWVIEPCSDYWQQIPRAVASSIVVIPSRLSYVDTLPPVSEFFKLLKKRWADISTVLIRPSLGSAYIFDTDVVYKDVQMDIDRHGDSPDSSVDSSLHFNANDISTEDDAALDKSILPSSAADICASLAALRESFSKLVANQTRDSRKSRDAYSEVMFKINHVERVFLDSLAVQNEAFRGLFKSTRQEAQNDNNALSLALKAVRAQNAILSTDLAATQKEVKDLKVALSKDFDDKLANILNDLLEFRVETQEQLASLGAHLAELIAFITKGSDDKKGEGSSSRPQPPPDDQNRPSCGSGSRANYPSRYGGGTVSREGGNRGGDGRRRGDSSGSSKRRRSDSGGGSGGRINYGPYLPPKRDAEYWISGKRQFKDFCFCFLYKSYVH